MVIAASHLRAPSLRLLVSVSAAIALPVSAQNSGVLEEIIVTANKRMESIQDVSTAITALSVDYLKEAGIDDFMAVTQVTPGFNMSAFSVGQPALYIRGIGSVEDGAAGDPSVATYVDGIYVGRAAGTAFNFLDVERIEVLRGPQGTLYGKNAIGGVISVVTARPHETLSGQAEVVAGDYHQRELHSSLNTPITDTLFANMALVYRQRDGYIDNRFTGKDNEHQDINDAAIHAQLRYEMNADFDITLGLDWEDLDRNGNGRHAEGDSSQAALHDANVYTTKTDVPGYQKKSAQGIRLEVNWLKPIGEFTSLTAYRENEYRWQENLYGLPVDWSTQLLNSTDETAEQFSQEFRLASADAGLWEWSVGAYYLRENVKRFESFDLSISPSFVVHEQWQQENTADSAALFGELGRQLTDTLSITGGLRYTSERKDFSNRSAAEPFPLFFLREEFDIEAKEDWQNTSWKIVGEYQLDQGMIYASIATGFKSGGFQGQPDIGEAAKQAFDPEYATNYELGLKTQLFDNSLRLNVALFYMDYEDLQVKQFVEVGQTPDGIPLAASVVENAAEAVTQGIEIEAHWALTANLELFGFYAYNDAQFKEFTQGDDDLSGNTLRNAPRNSYAINGRYTQLLHNYGEISVLLSYSYRDETFQSNENYPKNKFAEKEILDAKVSWHSLNEQWKLELWGKNLGNEEYHLHRIDGPDGEAPSSLYGMPRHYGVTLGYRF